MVTDETERHLSPLAPSDTVPCEGLVTNPIASIVSQHVEEAAHLRHLRTGTVRAPHVGLSQLALHDERLAAHLDGIIVAGPVGDELVGTALETPGVGEVFVATVTALERGGVGGLDHVLEHGARGPDLLRGLRSAIGWVSSGCLHGVAVAWLRSGSAVQRGLGLFACAAHEIDPLGFLARALEDPDRFVRAQACNTAARLGRQDLIESCVAVLDPGVPSLGLAAAFAALVLGERVRSVPTLEALAFDAGADPGSRDAALLTAILAADPSRARSLLAEAKKDDSRSRVLVRAVGWAGDVHFVPWLIGLMEDPAQARLAGESFTMITGVDLDAARLVRPPPLARANSDDSADIDLDEDRDLAWPDRSSVHAWWRENGARFSASQRWFLGGASDANHCARVLATGRQRHRWMAARHFALLSAGRRTFDVAAPAWRQVRRLRRFAG